MDTFGAACHVTEFGHGSLRVSECEHACVVERTFICALCHSTHISLITGGDERALYLLACGCMIGAAQTPVFV